MNSIRFGTDTAWDRFAATVTHRRSWAIALAVLVLSVVVVGSIGDNDAAGQAPSSLPPTAESAQVEELLGQFPNSDSAPVILVLSRADGGELTDSDVEAVARAQDRLTMVDRSIDRSPGPPPVLAPDGRAAIALVQVSSALSGVALNDLITELRAAASAGLAPDLRAQVTGGPAFGGDIADSFSGANLTLLAVTAIVVAVLLVATYRSPILWLVPLAVIGVADRIASTVGTALAQATGLSFDGSTSGITSVLVFGAGTNYALLLISRYREELRRRPDHRLALRLAVRRAGPAIVASNATVVLALLTLLLATLPSTRSLGALAAAGLVVAAVFVLFVLPPLLALCGPKLFWPFVPEESDRDNTTAGPWHSIAASVARRPALTSALTILALIAGCGALLGTQIGLSQTEKFRVAAESVEGFDTLSQHFPAGSADPVTVLAPTETVDTVVRTVEGTAGVTSVDRVADSTTGLTRLSVVTDTAPASKESFMLVENLRSALSGVEDARVGGSDAQALDIADGAARDRLVVVPAVLTVVLAVLVVLLRSAVAPLILIATTALSAVAALGLGSWVSVHIFGFPALDDNTPLFATLFLVALGVDYTIFLVTRTREETARHGTRSAVVRAVSATGGVITSAGIVLAAVFCVLGVLPLITLTQLGIIVGLGILLDTFVVRTVVIPALFTLIGPQIWWPSQLDPSHTDSPSNTESPNTEPGGAHS